MDLAPFHRSSPTSAWNAASGPLQGQILTLQVSTKTRGDVPEIPTQLYRHSKRPEWGLAVLVRQNEGRRAYQFEDGTLRLIKKGYYNLVEEVDAPDDAEAVHTSLVQAVADRKTNPNPSKHSVARSVCSFAAQVSLFVTLYPEGFEDPKWISDHRGEAGKTNLKRHREATLALAREALSPDQCALLIGEERHEELAEAAAEVLAGTNLVPISHVKAIQALQGDKRKEYAEVVAQLICHEGPYEPHYRAYLVTLKRLLGNHPSWRIGTALLALTHPQDHVCVRRSAFERQAGSIAPTASYTQKPRVEAYKNYRRVAMEVRKRLKAAGHEPRDLLDVHDFIWITLRKSAVDHHNGTKVQT